MTTPALALDRVTVRYDARIAVREVSASMTTGRWSALIGPNGAGKSSVLRAMADLVSYEGDLRILGERSERLARRRRARLLAYVPQQPALPAGMSVLEYALLGRTPHIGYFGAETERDRRVCAEALDRLGLADLAERHLATLSGGQRQRVVLARALAQEAPVLLLDEPTSALDLGRRVESLELVDELRRERGLTVVSAMHDLTLAAQFAHHMVLLHAGRVVACGPPAAVLDDTLLSECFGGRVRVITDGDGGLLVTTQRYQPHSRSRT